MRPDGPKFWYPTFLQDGNTALIVAAANGHAGIVGLLVKAGANLNFLHRVGKRQRCHTHLVAQ